MKTAVVLLPGLNRGAAEYEAVDFAAQAIEAARFHRPLREAAGGIAGASLSGWARSGPTLDCHRARR